MGTTFWVIVCLIAATFSVLVIGVVFMAIGGKLDRKYSTKLMAMRVVFQGLAILAIGLLMFLAN